MSHKEVSRYIHVLNFTQEKDTARLFKLTWRKKSSLSIIDKKKITETKITRWYVTHKSCYTFDNYTIELLAAGAQIFGDWQA